MRDKNDVLITHDKTPSKELSTKVMRAYSYPHFFLKASALVLGLFRIVKTKSLAEATIFITTGLNEIKSRDNGTTKNQAESNLKLVVA